MRDSIIDIPKDDPFKNDEFNRKVIAENFMKIFEADKEGIVLAIDSDWGTGKTTFIKMWESLLNNDDRYKDNYCSIYFNAWDNDYLEDPLLAILTEIKLREKDEEGQVNLAPEIFKEIFNPIYLVAKRGLDVALKLGTSGAIGVDDVFKMKEDDTQEKILEKMNEIGNEVLNRCANARKLRDEFKDKLSKFNDEYNKKLIFFIDELDRCRPSFAIELLETIKHLFSVPGVIFVVSLDKEQLSHSVATVYGQNMDTIGYLRRFFDLDYKLSSPNIVEYMNIKLEDVFERPGNIEYFEQFLKAFTIAYNFSLRDIDKLKNYLKLEIPIIGEFNRMRDSSMESIVKSYLYAYLISLKTKKPTLYKKIIDLDYENNLTEINNLFDLKQIKTIEFDVHGQGILTDEEIINLIRTDVIEKFLMANYEAKTNPLSLHSSTSKKYEITKDDYRMNYDIVDLFSYDGECSIIEDLEFMNDFKDFL